MICYLVSRIHQELSWANDLRPGFFIFHSMGCNIPIRSAVIADNQFRNGRFEFVGEAAWRRCANDIAEPGALQSRKPGGF